MYSQGSRRPFPNLPESSYLFPKCKDCHTAQQSRQRGSPDAKLPARLKRQHEQTAITSAPVPNPKAQEAASINAALLDMLVMCNVSFNTVDSAWFRRVCGTIRPALCLYVSWSALFAACQSLTYSSSI